MTPERLEVLIANATPAAEWPQAASQTDGPDPHWSAAGPAHREVEKAMADAALAVTMVALAPAVLDTIQSASAGDPALIMLLDALGQVCR